VERAIIFLEREDLNVSNHAHDSTGIQKMRLVAKLLVTWSRDKSLFKLLDQTDDIFHHVALFRPAVSFLWQTCRKNFLVSFPTYWNFEFKKNYLFIKNVSSAYLHSKIVIICILFKM
jgi:hypothetical protein